MIQPASIRLQRGFNLLELMITVAIVAILASIAYSSYQNQIVTSRRAAGAACLQERAHFMERFYTTNLTYTGAVISQCDNEIAPHYQVGVVIGVNGRTFTLSAVPQAMQATRDTLCGTLTLNERGTRGESGTAASANDCW